MCEPERVVARRSPRSGMFVPERAVARTLRLNECIFQCDFPMHYIERLVSAILWQWVSAMGEHS